VNGRGNGLRTCSRRVAGTTGRGGGNGAEPNPPGVTALLQAWTAGDKTARDRLLPMVYAELHRRAAACLRRERPGHLLQPTAVVNEAYLRLAGQQRITWKNRAQFFGVAAEMMRRILVDHARAGRAAKRSGRLVRVTLDERLTPPTTSDIDLLALDEALTRLAAFDKRKSAVAELRFFGGLSLEETGAVLGISVATVEREWQAARAWLYAALK
jgi:RNA polymerase sigma factor (TIGR02999 family)